MVTAIMAYMDHTRATLLLRVRDTSDQQSWNEFCEIYQPFLLNVAYKCGVKERDADDLVSEILMTCLKVLPTFEYDREKGSFRGWLKTITRNKLNDWYRRKERSGDRVPIGPGVEPAVRVDIWDQWDQDYRARLLAAALEAVREQSDVTTWGCFDEHILKQRRAGDVASELGMQTNSVYVNAHRVKERVCNKVAELDEDLVDA